MVVTGAEHAQKLVADGFGEAKMVFNQRGAIIFSATRQHREMKGDGISYEDNYAGDALAAMLRPDAVEIRYHRAFDDAKVAWIVRELLKTPELSCLGAARVTYQGRVLA